MKFPYSGNLPGRKHGECEAEFARALGTYCRNLRNIKIDQSGNDACLRILLQIPKIEAILFNSHNNADVSGRGLKHVVCPSLKHLHLNAMCKVDGKGLLEIARACPN